MPLSESVSPNWDSLLASPRKKTMLKMCELLLWINFPCLEQELFLEIIKAQVICLLWLCIICDRNQTTQNVNCTALKSWIAKYSCPSQLGKPHFSASNNEGFVPRRDPRKWRIYQYQRSLFLCLSMLVQTLNQCMLLHYKTYSHTLQYSRPLHTDKLSLLRR